MVVKLVSIFSIKYFFELRIIFFLKLALKNVLSHYTSDYIVNKPIIPFLNFRMTYACNVKGIEEIQKTGRM